MIVTEMKKIAKEQKKDCWDTLGGSRVLIKLVQFSAKGNG